MGALRAILALLTSRWLWSAIGLACLAALVWIFGGYLAFGAVKPLASETARLGLIAALVLLWLLWVILRQRRAIRANRLFVTELAVRETKPADPGAEAIAAVAARFQSVLAELARRKLGGARLREMPWYVIIGPPAAGKTTALRQSGLSFPFDLGDDLHGLGGTRNCDWFFTENAVLIDTAGRYVLQESAPEIDAAEWLGFLDLLRRHRGRRALNGVLLALPADLLAAGESTLRMHGREIRKRLAEIEGRLKIRLPVYLLVTKADLLRGFEASFDGLAAADREQVWGTTFPPGERPDGAMVARELALLVRALDARAGNLMQAEDDLARRAEIFRFPTQVAGLEAPLRILVDTIFGESRYEASAWLRGLYLTSATQEGTPIDRLTASLAAGFGLPAAPEPYPRRTEPRSFFLRRLLTDVIFPEAGLATLDPAAEARRVWLRRGAAVGAAGLASLAATAFVAAYWANRGVVVAQTAAFDGLAATLAPVAARQVPLDPSDLGLALDAVAATEAARVAPAPAWARLIGPSAAPEVVAAQDEAMDHALRFILEPRMVALLEATLWAHIRDADFLLGGLKSYRMLTGSSPVDLPWLQAWWTDVLPGYAPTDPFPTKGAPDAAMAALARKAGDPAHVAEDPALVAAALEGVCQIPLARRAWDALRSDPAVVAAVEWSPAAHAGPNGEAIFIRRSGKSLRAPIDGAFTWAGFHDAILPRLGPVAEAAALDSTIFAGRCDERAEPGALAEDMLKLYYDDFIAQWDGLLRDITLAPITDIRTADVSLRDLAGTDSSLRRLLTAAAAETDLARPAETAADPAAPKPPASILKKLGKAAKWVKAGLEHLPAGSTPAIDTSGQPVSDHFAPLRATVTGVDGAPPGLDAAAASLAALSAMLGKIAAAPNPDAAITAEGGLAALTAAVGNDAATLPEPLDGWLAGLGGLQAVTAKAVVDQLNATWRADVLPFCAAATAGRYPFDAGAAIDVTRQDFQRLFGPGGLIDTFVTGPLAPYVDTARDPWRWQTDLGLSTDSLAAFEAARSLRDALFVGGVGPTMSFSLQPTDMTGAGFAKLVIDNKPLEYRLDAVPATAFTWPGADVTDVITLTFRPLDGSPDVTVKETGPWALLRLLRKNRLEPTGRPEAFHLRLAIGSAAASYDLLAGSVANPFDLKLFSGFRCPDRL